MKNKSGKQSLSQWLKSKVKNKQQESNIATWEHAIQKEFIQPWIIMTKTVLCESA